MRVESSRPMHNGGWMHLSGGAGQYHPRPRSGPAEYKNKAVPVPPAQNFEALLRAWRCGPSNAQAIDDLATELNVPYTVLLSLGACYSDYYHAHAFPMTLPDASVSGIRLRNSERKWSVKGSHSALFIPWNSIGKLPTQTAMICEGPTDTAAALALGFFAIGRPACLGCEEMVSQVIRNLGTREVILCYDNDEPGVRGANKLAESIPCRVIRFVPPTKDLRQFLQSGGSHSLLLSIIGNTVRTRN